MLSKFHHDADADMEGIYKGLNYVVEPCVLVGRPADVCLQGLPRRVAW